MADELGWLIEAIDGPTPHWWDGGEIPDCWTPDSLNAVRFPRKEDAEKVIENLLEDCHFDLEALEHMWQDVPNA